MLFKMKDLVRIKNGTISIAFRKWKNARVKIGSQIKTALGLIEIESCDLIPPEQLTEELATEAGYNNLSELINLLPKFPEGNLYKIKLKYAGEDPRISLRENDDIDDSQLLRIFNKLNNMDKKSIQGPWTYQVLKSIEQFPQLKAADLASKLNKEKDWLKLNVRKLKNMGLTISHGTGYSLSARGKYVLDKLESRK